MAMLGLPSPCARQMTWCSRPRGRWRPGFRHGLGQKWAKNSPKCLEHRRKPPESQWKTAESKAFEHVLEDKRLAALKIELKTPVAPVANYKGWRRSGNVVYISGQIPKDGDQVAVGQVGKELSAAEAAQAARLCGLNLLAQMRDACGGKLDRVKSVPLGSAPRA